MDTQIDMARRLLVVDDARLQSFIVSRAMASLGFVAEGIETQAIEARLRVAGCQIGQGWHFGRAMAEPALHAWLADRARIPA